MFTYRGKGDAHCLTVTKPVSPSKATVTLRRRLTNHEPVLVLGILKFVFVPLREDSRKGGQIKDLSICGISDLVLRAYLREVYENKE